MGGILKGVGFAFAAVSSVKDWTNFSDQDLQTKLATVGNTLQLGDTGAQLASSILSASASNASSALGAAEDVAERAARVTGKFLGPAGAALSTVSEGFFAYDEFSKGNVQAGIGHSLTALGGLTLAASAFLDASIAGAPAGLVLGAVGGLLSVGGAIVSAFTPDPNPFESQKGDLKAELEAAGLNKRTAEKLAVFNSDGSALGDWIYQVANRAGVPPKDFLQSMNRWSDEQLTRFIDAGRLQHDTDDNNDNRLDNARKVLGDNADTLEDRHVYNRGTPAPGRPPLSQEQVDQMQKDLRVHKDKHGQTQYVGENLDRAVKWLHEQGILGTQQTPIPGPVGQHSRLPPGDRYRSTPIITR